jgi:pyroglutamyl-peptidase
VDRRSFLLLSLLALGGCCSAPCAPAAPVACAPRAVVAPAAEPPVVLVTAFEPFGGATVNPSWEASKDLDGTMLGGWRVRVVRLPVVYDEMAAPLDAAVAKHRPSAIVSFGQGRGIVQVERVARNCYHPRKPPDNAGKPPPREKIDPAGPDSIPSTLPADDIVTALKAAGIEAGTSDDAGGYLCNECFWRDMREPCPAGHSIVARGFVHVPAIGAKNPLGGIYDLDVLKKAVRLVLETTLSKAPLPRS